MAEFFFWKPGNANQKNLQGMKTSIIYQLVLKCPKLTKILFPSQWESISTKIFAFGPTEAGIHFRFCAPDIDKAFDTMLRNDDIGREYRFCFFLDALDEYEDSNNCDYLTLVDALKKTVDIGNGRVKICLSSREENAFVDQFDKKKQYPVTGVDEKRHGTICSREALRSQARRAN